ncbi:Protein of unknown function [Gryllus bimaculatus]|nr:Protein of unknown function [Gryllus bimaculatus]
MDVNGLPSHPTYFFNLLCTLKAFVKTQPETKLVEERFPKLLSSNVFVTSIEVQVGVGVGTATLPVRSSFFNCRPVP